MADLGVTSHLLGNLFWEVVASHGFGNSDKEGNVKALYSDLKAWYARTTKGFTRIQGKLTIARIKNEW